MLTYLATISNFHSGGNASAVVAIDAVAVAVNPIFVVAAVRVTATVVASFVAASVCYLAVAYLSLATCFCLVIADVFNNHHNSENNSEHKPAERQPQ